MRWSFDLTCADEAAVAKVNFQQAEGEVPLHLDYRRFRGGLIANRREAGAWQTELAIPVSGALPETLVVTVEATAEGKVFVSCPGAFAEIPWTDADSIERARIWLEGSAAQRATKEETSAALRAWRLHPWGSGFEAKSARLARRRAERDFRRGLSVVIRARNEAHVVGRCLAALDGLADEIVFTDNGSTDQTALIARRMQARMFELRLHSYPETIPQAGTPHAREVLAGGSNTLGHYYNWCLGHASCTNFMKWDADYIAIRQNLSEMIDMYCLRTREDNFVLWFSGLEVYTDGTRHWVDRNSIHSEFRVFSALHGHEWVNLPPWEEIDQRALFRAQKLFHPKPVYAELFRLDPVEFRDRGLWEEDRRDAERRRILRDFAGTGALPASFEEVEGPEDPRLAGLELSPREMEMARHFDRRYRSRPGILHRDTETLFPAGQVAQEDLAVLVISCAKYADKQQAIRETWGADLDRLGIPRLFVVGRPGEPARIVGDILYLPVPDTYEALAAKVAAAFEYTLNFMNVDYVLKIDDDCVLDAFRFLEFEPGGRDFVGGSDAGVAGNVTDWHIGKCTNAQLDDLPVFRAPGFRWVGGQYGYVLSRRARLVLVRERARLRSSLYEDYAVARVLAEQGIAPAWPFGHLRALKHDEDWRDTPNVCIVADVPDAETMREVHAELVGAEAADRAMGRFMERYDVKWDWMDIEAVRMRLGA